MSISVNTWTEDLPSGRVRAVVRIGGRKGARQSRTFDYPTEAEAWLEDMRNRAAAATADVAPAAPVRVAAGPAAPAGSWSTLTVAKAVTAHVDRRAAVLEAATVSFYRSQANGIAKDAELASSRIADLTRPDVQDWITRQVELGTGRPSIKARLKLLVQVATAMHDDGLIPRNPTKDVEAPHVPEAEIRPATDEELASLLASAAGDVESTALVLLGSQAGLRWQEAAALDVSAVNLDSNVITVRQVLERNGKVRPYPKSKRPRMVPITPDLRKALVALDLPARSGLIFRSEAGTGLDYHNHRRSWWLPLCAAAGVQATGPDGLGFHGLRHTAGTALANAGVPRHRIATILGHADEATTKRYIATADTAVLADDMGKAFGKVGKRQRA